MSRHRARNSEKRIAKLEKEGRGQGIGADYKPYILVHDFSSRGRVHRRLSRVHGRVVHLFSDIEEDIFLKFDENPATLDIREQFPLPRAETMRIADRLGVRHPIANGVPTVMTTDLVIDLPRRRLALAIKPAAELSKTRVLEKLDIEKAYWRDRDTEWHIVLDDAVSRAERIGMQERAAWGHDHIVASDPTVDWNDRANVMLVEVADAVRGRLNDFCSGVEERHGWSKGEALSAVMLLLARRHLVLRGCVRLDAFGPVTQLAFETEVAA